MRTPEEDVDPGMEMAALSPADRAELKDGGPDGD